MKKTKPHIAHLTGIFIALCIFTGTQAQNWSPFNASYRYNYKFDQSTLISQVIFSDTVKVSGSDTIYALNRIGVECTGSCPGLSVAIAPSQTVIVPNMPQFLQRTIKKYSNGMFSFLDTAKLVILPQCLLNQTWVFDSINNINATCLAKFAQINFGQNDSVKLIRIGLSDTLFLSKNFGILQFPELYNKHKKYKLVGIEKAGSYDINALFGLKVPNYWDFYKFDPGDKFCYERSYFKIMGSGGNVIQECYFGNYTILTGSIVNGSYNYTVSGFTQNCYSPTLAPTQNMVPLNSTLSVENKMYPGQIVPYFFYPEYTNIVRFGTDNNGIFYKYAGPGCISYSPINMPFINAYNGIKTNVQLNYSHYVINPNSLITMAYGVGLGRLYTRINPSGTSGLPSQHDFFCTTCAVKNQIPYFGNQTYVGLDENQVETEFPVVYPNPARDHISIHFGIANISEIRIADLMGREIVREIVKDSSKPFDINISDQKAGLYFIHFYSMGRPVIVYKLLVE